MKEKVINKVMDNIAISNNNLDNIKLEEIKYGLLGLYGLVSKTLLIAIISIILGIFKEFILFLTFYGVLRSVGFGCHATSNIKCWILTTTFLIGFPYMFSNINLSIYIKLILWSICFINYIIFCPADTAKKPIISLKRKMTFKYTILLISIIYLIIVLNYSPISNLIIAAMLLEAFLTNPIGYKIMGQKIRFKLNDIYLFKQKR